MKRIETNSGFSTALIGSEPLPDPEAEAGYTTRTDHGLASDRSKHRVRSHEELASAKISEPKLGEGVSFRQAIAGQGVNDQFPYSTDKHGKQIA